MTLTGTDFGADLKGFINNFAWGTLDISGELLDLGDGNKEEGGAFYVGSLLGLQIDQDTITNITGNDFNIYYLAGLEANDYLGGLNYNLSSGGQLIAVAESQMPVPAPGAGLLLTAGLWALCFARKTVNFRG